MTDFAGKNILITGAASGIGRGMALKMASEGGKMVLWDIATEKLGEVKQKIIEQHGTVFTYTCDLCNREEIYANIEKVKKEVGTIDILINNAGIVSGKDFLHCTDEQIQRTFNVNTMAVMWLTKAILPDMMEKNRGHLVTISSASGLIGISGLADYSASKFAVFGFHEAIRSDLRKKKLNIRTTIVCPYYINTGMFQGVKTRFPFLLPILEESKVVDKIIRFIKKDKPILMMPWLIYTTMPLRILPVALYDAIADFLGVNHSMDEFMGRK